MVIDPSWQAHRGRRYSSFLIRCWRVGEGEERLQLEHIQSGACTRVLTLGEALVWMCSCWDAAPGPVLSLDGD